MSASCTTLAVSSTSSFVGSMACNGIVNSGGMTQSGTATFDSGSTLVVTGVSTFANPPSMSGGSIASSTIQPSSVVGSCVTLTTAVNQTKTLGNLLLSSGSTLTSTNPIIGVTTQTQQQDLSAQLPSTYLTSTMYFPMFAYPTAYLVNTTITPRAVYSDPYLQYTRTASAGSLYCPAFTSGLFSGALSVGSGQTARILSGGTLTSDSGSAVTISSGTTLTFNTYPIISIAAAPTLTTQIGYFSANTFTVALSGVSSLQLTNGASSLNSSAQFGVYLINVFCQFTAISSYVTVDISNVTTSVPTQYGLTLTNAMAVTAGATATGSFSYVLQYYSTASTSKYLAAIVGGTVTSSLVSYTITRIG